MVNLAQKIKQISTSLGFSYCGISACKQLDDDARRLENWLSKSYHGEMSYMENHFDLRINPAKLVPGAKSVITLMMNYYPARSISNNPKIAKYAYGKDYHLIIKEKLNELLFRIREIAGMVDGRGFVDSAPVLERAWARESGLGWVGKNGNLITKKNGSFFFIATLITDLVLTPDDAFAKDYCGSCTRCIDACPTAAIEPGKTINASKCIAYFTIELKSMIIPQEMKGKFDNWLFGCDICQDVCPWNRFSAASDEAGFQPIENLLQMTTKDWYALGEAGFKAMFRQSPIKRTKYTGLLRNLRFLQP
jgi:epoxyqueuosine reductase